VKEFVGKITTEVAAGHYVKPKQSMDPLACQLQLLAMIMEVNMTFISLYLILKFGFKS